MKISSRSRLTCAVILFLSLSILFIARRAETRAVEGEAYAIKGGTVITVTGATIPNGIVVVRNGLIVDVGSNIAIPGDAKVIEANGMMVYPGLIDAYTTYGLRPPAPPPQGAGGGDPIQAQMAAPPSTVGLLPEASVTEQLQIAAETFDAQRSAGITAALTGLRDGVFRGQSAFINLGSEGGEKVILKAPASLNVAFTGARGGYPGSAMGVIAFLRQNFMDAQHYREAWSRYNKTPRGMTRPEVSKSMASLQPAINGEMPVIFNAGSVREMKRAVGLAEEFSLKYLIAGATQAYLNADWLKQKNATVLLSLSYPQKPAGLDDPEEESLRALRERAEAPKAAAALHKAGVRFAFTSGTLTRPQDFITNAARAIEAGLPKDEALKALTIYPAQIFGLSEQLGSLEKGKIANVIVTSGDLFNKDSKVRHVFVDGKHYAIKAAEAPRGPAAAGSGRGGARPTTEAAAPAVAAAGTWAITINTPDGAQPGTLTLRQDGENVSGDIQTPLGNAPVTGKIKGNELSFEFRLNLQGQEVPISGTGKIEGNSVTGTVSAMGQGFDFSGSRRPQ